MTVASEYPVLHSFHLLSRTLIIGALSIALTACSSAPTDSASEAMGGSGARGALCESDEECDDGAFCTGVSVCDPSAALADASGCVLVEKPCISGSQSCEESKQRCVTLCDVDSDADRDGSKAIECGGADCDDADPDRFPGNAEICDSEHHDEDCDPLTYGVRDQDKDLSPDGSCCNVDEAGKLHCGDDCDDTNAGANPRVPEVCDGFDNDCDGEVDEGVTRPAYADKDGDGYGDPTAPVDADCSATEGLSSNGLDCDDSSAEFKPGAQEICDGLDNNCDGIFERDLDGDGHLPPNSLCVGGGLPLDDCNDLDAATYPGAPELCDGYDNDCDSVRDDRLDADGTCAARADLAGAFCISETCEVVQCETGYGDCNRSSVDGCETALLEDAKNCGGCGVLCPLGAECSGGVCEKVGFVAVSVGESHACALSSAGGVGCWGENSFSQLGNGFTRSSDRMVDALGLDDAVHLAVGLSHSCITTATGDIECWGNGVSSELGLGGGVSQSTPTSLGVAGYGQIFAGGQSSCALSNGEAHCWGWDVDLDGRGAVPEFVPFSSGVLEVSTDTYRHCAILLDGTLECAGHDTEYLANGDQAVSQSCGVDYPNGGDSFLRYCNRAPVTVAGVTGATQLSGSCVLNNGAIECWDNPSDLLTEVFAPNTAKFVELAAHDDTGVCGLTGEGEVFCQVPFVPQTIPVSAVAMGGSAEAIDVGKHALCAVVDGNVKCRGGGPVMGLATGQISADAKTIAPPAGVIALQIGGGFDCATTSTGTAQCFGPELIGVEMDPDFQGAIAIEGARSMNCALFGDGSIGCKGKNDFGQLGSPGDESFRKVDIAPARAVTTNGLGVCAVLKSGELWCWGHSQSGNLGSALPENSSDLAPTKVPGLSGVLSAQMGRDFSCALDKFGQVRCWGEGSLGQLGNGEARDHLMPQKVSIYDDVVQLGVGWDFACALRLDGSVWCWGDGTRGQLGFEDLVTSSKTPLELKSLKYVTMLSTGSSHACTANSTGELSCWGSNSGGQIGTGQLPSSFDDLLPITRIGDFQVRQLVARGASTCVLTTADEPLCWGTDIQKRALDGGDDHSCEEVVISESVFSVGFETCPAPTLVKGL